jgi:hypothetical protein
MLICSHFINVLYSISLRFNEDKFSCTLLESNELIRFEENSRGGGGRTAYSEGADDVLAPKKKLR